MWDHSSSTKLRVQLLDLKPSGPRPFDLIKVNGHRKVEEAVQLSNPTAVTLVEVKSTKKRLDYLPHGFFFGATENEFRVAEKLGGQYKFCFVSLHKDSRAFSLLTLAELSPLIKTKRTQFQINLASAPVK